MTELQQGMLQGHAAAAASSSQPSQLTSKLAVASRLQLFAAAHERAPRLAILLEPSRHVLAVQKHGA